MCVLLRLINCVVVMGLMYNQLTLYCYPDCSAYRQVSRDFVLKQEQTVDDKCVNDVYVFFVTQSRANPYTLPQ